MPVEVIVYQQGDRHRSRSVCDAMFVGITKAGDRVIRKMESEYRKPEGDVAVFYGMGGNLRRLFEDYRAAGLTAVYADLGYWGRKPPGRTTYTGFHKVSVNARHPTAYFQRIRHNSARVAVHNVAVKPWRSEGTHILLAGMGKKASEFEGLIHEEWERGAIARIREQTDRPIVYRPKPNCRVSRPISGTVFSPPAQPLKEALAGCHAVVTHHSNVAVEAIAAGVPAFVWEGVAAPMSLSDLRQIEAPIMPDGREQWLADIAWTQWSIAEMASGETWRYLKDEKLVPA